MQHIFLKRNWSRRFATLFLALFLFMAVPVPAARAGVWGEDLLATFLGITVKEILKFIEDVLKGVAKSLAVQLAVRQANRLTGNGDKNGPSFITDYKRYIYAAALDESMVFMNDFMTKTLGAKYAAVLYAAMTGNLQPLGRSYMNYLYTEAQAGLTEGYCRYTLDQYTSNPIQSLQRGNWRVFSAIIVNSCNNPTGFSRQVRTAFQKDLQRRQDLARTRALAGQGFVGVGKNGKITAPGSLIKDIIAKAETSAFDLIPNANGWGEILAAAAGAFVNTVMNNLIQNGFESVAKTVDRELGKVDAKVNDARKDIEQQLGPGAYFYLRDTAQQIGSRGSQNTEAKISFPTTPRCVGSGC